MIPPYLAGEVSSRMLKQVPELRELLNLEEITLSGSQMESMMRATWMCGYADALFDLAKSGEPLPDLPELAQWISDNVGD